MVKRKKVTLKDVAAAVELAVPTVSQILNGKKNFCSAEQCQRVRETAKKMGYITNIGYRIMTGMETHTVGIMVACSEQMQENHNRELVLQLTSKMSDLGWAAFCHVLPDTSADAVSKVQEFIGRGVEKFIFIGMPFGYNEIFDILEKNNIPYIGNRSTMPRFCSSDALSARIQLLEYLNKKTDGKFRIMWWYGEFDDNFSVWSDTLDTKEKIVDLPKISNDHYEDTFRIGYDAIKNLLTADPDIRGAMFPNDAYAIGAAQYLHEQDIRNFTLVGFNGDRDLLRFPYPVSTGIQPIAVIVDEIAGFFTNGTAIQKLVPVKLILK